MRDQLKDLRISFDWDKEVSTCDPSYYKWTQSLFLLMYSRGLAYRMKASTQIRMFSSILFEEMDMSQGGKLAYSWSQNCLLSDNCTYLLQTVDV
mgnify:CR=1 FL=1